MGSASESKADIMRAIDRFAECKYQAEPKHRRNRLELSSASLLCPAKICSMRWYRKSWNDQPFGKGHGKALPCAFDFQQVPRFEWQKEYWYLLRLGLLSQGNNQRVVDLLRWTRWPVHNIIMYFCTANQASQSGGGNPHRGIFKTNIATTTGGRPSDYIVR